MWSGPPADFASSSVWPAASFSTSAIRMRRRPISRVISTSTSRSRNMAPAPPAATEGAPSVGGNGSEGGFGLEALMTTFREGRKEPFNVRAEARSSPQGRDLHCEPPGLSRGPTPHKLLLVRAHADGAIHGLVQGPHVSLV